MPDINIGAIVEALNDKVDRDCQNIDKTTGEPYLAGLSMPSSTGVDLTAGADGAEYEAPANGWFVIGGAASGNLCMVGFNEFSYHWITNGSGNGMKASIPVRKGAKVHARWINVTSKYIKFTYAVGSESEAS